MDLQIAISRCWLHDTETACQLAEKKLTGEWKALMLFLLNKDRRPTGPFTNEVAWMISALTKSPHVAFPELANLVYSENPRALYTGQHPWKTFVEAYQTTDYNWKDGKMVTKPVTKYRKVIRLDLSVQKGKTTSESGFKKFINKITGAKPEPAKEPAPLLYDYLQLKSEWLSTEDRDIRRLYLLTPSNPEPMLAMTLQKCLDEATFSGETQKRFVIEVPLV